MIAGNLVLTCKRCGSNSYTTEMKLKNFTASCSKCGAYIKNIPYDPPKMHFGKYKDYLIEDIDDLEYLEWCMRTLKLTKRIKDSMRNQIESLKLLMR